MSRFILLLACMVLLVTEAVYADGTKDCSDAEIQTCGKLLVKRTLKVCATRSAYKLGCLGEGGKSFYLFVKS